MRPTTGMRALTAAALFSTLPLGVLAADVLSTNSFSTCLDNSEIRVDKLDVSYNKNTRKITFDVAGESTTAQNVTAKLVVSAYGKQFYEKTFSPCDQGMKEMCPGMCDCTGLATKRLTSLYSARRQICIFRRTDGT